MFMNRRLAQINIDINS